MTEKILAGLLTAVIGVGAHAGAQPVGAETWVNVTGNLAKKLSECGTLTLLSPVPGSDTILAGVAGRGLWASTTGSTWSRVGDGPGSDRINNRASWIVYDPVDPSLFWESGIYSDAGVYKTTDGGKTFQRLGTVRHNDYLSVDFSDPERQTLLAGGHEQGQLVHLTLDGGKTWTNVGVNLPDGSGASTHPFIIDGGVFLVNAAGPTGGSGGIYRSKDSGQSWQKVSAMGPVAAPLRASTGILYWPTEGSLLRSTDFGSSWIAVGSGLRAIHPVELPDGRLVAVGDSTLQISADRGNTWSPLGPVLPYRADGMIYSPQRKAFYVWRGDCKEEVPRDAVMSFEFDASAPGTSRAPAR